MVIRDKNNKLVKIENGDSVSFYKNDRRHNSSGPAIIFNGEEEYWLEGKKYSKEEWLKITRKEKLAKLLEK